MKKYIKNIVPVAALLLSLGTTSCVGDLDVTPINPNIQTNLDINGLFNKCYANFALAGNSGGNGDCDIDGLDGGTTGFVRQMFNANELTTDEAICGWGDEGIASFCYNSYNASHPMLYGFYARITTGIAYCNQYLAEAGGNDATMAAEIRFLRAFEYFTLMDAWGNIPFTLNPLTKPVQYSRAQAYEWIEKELLDIEGSLSEAKAKKSTDAGYGRVDKAACWLLLSRLYLNAEVYTGTPQWEKAKTYAKKVMDSDYKLNLKGKDGWSAYQMLFMGDNGETDAAYEGIFPLLQDGLKTTSWGTSLFLMASTYDENMHGNPNDAKATNGTDQNWGGNRARPDLVKKFFPQGEVPHLESYATAAAAGDDRALFNGVDRTLDNEDVATFKSGYAVGKFTNFKTKGVGSDATFCDADFFLMRKAEAYLNYAEADARLNGNKTTAEGTAAINAIRSRAKATTRPETSSYSLSEICDEWSREFYFEGRRRMDLIRFNRYGGNVNYNWQWKGGTKEGRNFSKNLNIFAIPTNDLVSNKNLTQNPGY